MSRRWAWLDRDGQVPASLLTLAPDMTAAEILALLLTVDGPGSGLDADTLDGSSSAAFATAGSGLTKVTSSATSTTIVNSSAAGTLFTQSISGAAAADTYQLTLFGDYLNNSGGASTGIFTVTLGSTSIACTATSWNTGAQRREWRLVVDIVVGAIAAQRVSTWVTQAAATADNWPMSTTAAGAAPGYVAMAEDLTTAKTLLVTHTHSVANAATEIVCAGAILTRLR